MVAKHTKLMSRNSRCPCGSGKKHKVCCGRIGPIPSLERLNGAYVDRELRKVVFVTKDMVINQLKRDTPRIARSFDTAMLKAIEEVSEVVGSVFTILAPQIIGRDLSNQSREPTCAGLLNTAAATFLGCVHLARGGYRLQYMTLSRSVVETLCTVMHMMVDAEAVRDFHAGSLKSTKSVTISSKVLPVFGRIWGELSNQFVHINTMHSGLNRLSDYKIDDEDLLAINMNMKLTVWLLYVATELAFLEDIERPRYWRIANRNADKNEVHFDPSKDEKSWQARFFGRDFED